MTLAEKGDVADIDPAFFVGYLHRLKATGTLKFEDPPIQRAIYFRDGRILFSSSNAPEDQLGAILVAAGKIEQDQFDFVVASLQPKQSIAAALAQAGHVSQRDIGDAARRKVEQIIGSCCAQNSGRYEFDDGVLPKGALDLKLTTEKVLVAAFEALEPSGFLIRVLKSPMAVLAQGEGNVEDPDLVTLRDALDGVSSLADIGGAVGLSLPATEVRAAVLVVLGAASVVTSQIEEMSLPDTGETASPLPIMSSEESETLEAETFAFAPGAEAGAGFASDSTLVVPPESESGLGGSNDLTLTPNIDPSGPAPTTPVASGLSHGRATTQDLAAIKELIGKPSTPPPRPGSASIPAQRWEPVLSAAGRPGRDRGSLQGTFQSPVVKAAAALFLIVGVSAVGWLAYSGNQSGLVRPAPPAPRPSPSASVAAADPGAGALLPVPPAANTSAPVASTPAPVPSTPTPSPAPVATVKPTVAPTPKATPIQTPPPAPAAAALGVSTTSGSGYLAMKAGRLDEAATAFANVARSRRTEFSVQVLVACSAQTIGKAIENDPSSDLFVLAATINGRPCHRLLRGFFKTNAEAARSVSSFPPYYAAEGAKPRAVAVNAVLP